MNKMLEETFAQQKPDPAFEQRMLTAFRQRIPERGGLVKLLSDLMRLRAAQVTTVAAVLIGLVLLGGMFTRETAIAPRTRDKYANEQLFRQRSPIGASDLARAGALGKSDELAAEKPQDLALVAQQSSSESQTKLERAPEAFAPPVAPAKTAQVKTGSEEAMRCSRTKLNRDACAGIGQSQTDPQRHGRTRDHQL